MEPKDPVPTDAIDADSPQGDGIDRRSFLDWMKLVAVSGVAGAALTEQLLPGDAEAQAPADGKKRFLLIGLCEPKDEASEAAFVEWFVDQHIEDTTHCPNFVRGRVYKLQGPHLKIKSVSKYISVYEVDATSWDEAEKVLNAWQRDPNAWAGRKAHQETGKRMGGVPMTTHGSGWYELLKSFDGPAAKTTRWS